MAWTAQPGGLASRNQWRYNGTARKSERTTAMAGRVPACGQAPSCSLEERAGGTGGGTVALDARGAGLRPYAHIVLALVPQGLRALLDAPALAAVVCLVRRVPGRHVAAGRACPLLRAGIGAGQRIVQGLAVLVHFLVDSALDIARGVFEFRAHLAQFVEFDLAADFCLHLIDIALCAADQCADR